MASDKSFADLQHAMRVNWGGWPVCPVCGGRTGQVGFLTAPERVVCLQCVKAWAAKNLKEKKTK